MPRLISLPSIPDLDPALLPPQLPPSPLNPLQCLSSSSVVALLAFLQLTLFLREAQMSYCSTSKGEHIFSRNSFCQILKIKCRFMGGNSTKATSGINGAGTTTQQTANIPDNAQIFFEDTKKSVSLCSLLLNSLFFDAIFVGKRTCSG